MIVAAPLTGPVLRFLMRLLGASVRCCISSKSIGLLSLISDGNKEAASLSERLEALWDSFSVGMSRLTFCITFCFSC